MFTHRVLPVRLEVLQWQAWTKKALGIFSLFSVDCRVTLAKEARRVASWPRTRTEVIVAWAIDRSFFVSLQAAKSVPKNNTRQNRGPGVVLQLLECLAGARPPVLYKNRHGGACL